MPTSCAPFASPAITQRAEGSVLIEGHRKQRSRDRQQGVRPLIREPANRSRPRSPAKPRLQILRDGSALDPGSSGDPGRLAEGGPFPYPSRNTRGSHRRSHDRPRLSGRSASRNRVCIGTWWNGYSGKAVSASPTSRATAISTGWSRSRNTCRPMQPRACRTRRSVHAPKHALRRAERWVRRWSFEQRAKSRRNRTFERVLQKLRDANGQLSTRRPA